MCTTVAFTVREKRMRLGLDGGAKEGFSVDTEQLTSRSRGGTPQSCARWRVKAGWSKSAEPSGRRAAHAPERTLRQWRIREGPLICKYPDN